MEGVPISSYLDRKHREKLGLPPPPGPNQPENKPPAEDLYEKGVADGMQRAKAACDEAIARQQAATKLQLDIARKAWAQTQGTAFAQQIGNAMSAMEADISEAVGRVLKPFAAQKLVDLALAKLVNEIKKLLSQEDAIHLKISGPSDLILELRNHFPPHIAVTVQEGNKPEVTVIANKTVIETRLSEWLVRIGVESRAEGQEEQGRA